MFKICSVLGMLSIEGFLFCSIFNLWLKISNSNLDNWSKNIVSLLVILFLVLFIFIIGYIWAEHLEEIEKAERCYSNREHNYDQK